MDLRIRRIEAQVRLVSAASAVGLTVVAPSASGAGPDPGQADAAAPADAGAADAMAAGASNGEPSVVAGEGPSFVARALFNDISAAGMGLFLPHRIAANQCVEIRILDPEPITLRGRIVWCHEHLLTSRVISLVKYAYRAGLEFTFESAEHEARAKAFVEQVYRRL